MQSNLTRDRGGELFFQVSDIYACHNYKVNQSETNQYLIIIGIKLCCKVSFTTWFVLEELKLSLLYQVEWKAPKAKGTRTFFLDTLNYIHQNSKNFKRICSVTEVVQSLYKLKRSTLGNCGLLRINNGHMRTKTDVRQWRSKVLPQWHNWAKTHTIKQKLIREMEPVLKGNDFGFDYSGTSRNERFATFHWIQYIHAT